MPVSPNGELKALNLWYVPNFENNSDDAKISAKNKLKELVYKLQKVH